MIAVFSALRQEVSELRKEMSVSRISSLDRFGVIEGKYGGKDILLVLTGVGKKNALKAVQLVLEKYPASAIISTGFGGALNEKTRVGDIVVCSSLYNGEAPPLNNESLESDSQLVSASQKTLVNAGSGFLIGTGVTVPFVSSTPENKISLGKQYQADTVEMESYWIAGIAADRKLPFLEARSISDSVQDDLSFLTRIVSGSGKIKPMSAAACLISHPESIKKIRQLDGNAKKAERSLALFLGKLIKEI